MDQLKILLEHKFWLLAGLAALLPPIGWYMATDDLATKTKSRQHEVDTAFNDVVLKETDQYPNDGWIQGAKKIDGDLAKMVDESQTRLYERQKAAMVFPKVVQTYLDEAHAKFRSEPKENLNVFQHAKLAFANIYDQEWENVMQVLDPFVATTGEGKIVIGDGLTLDQVGNDVVTRALEGRGRPRRSSPPLKCGTRKRIFGCSAPSRKPSRGSTRGRLGLTTRRSKGSAGSFCAVDRIVT